MIEPSKTRGSRARDDDPLADLARIVYRDPREDETDEPRREEARRTPMPGANSRSKVFSTPQLRGSYNAMKSDDHMDDDLRTAPPVDDDGYGPDDDDGPPPQAYDENYDYEDEYEAEPQERRGFKGLVTLSVVIALTLLGGGFVYAWKHGYFIGSSLPGLGGEAPVISASKVPVKVVPTPDTGGQSAAAAKGTGGGEKLVTREEQPVAVLPGAAVVGEPEPAYGTGPVAVAPKPEPVVDPIVNAAPAEPQAAEPGTPAKIVDPTRPEPRRVRTVKVLADGTVVTGEAETQTAAATPIAPVVQPEPVVVDPAPAQPAEPPANDSRAITAQTDGQGAQKSAEKIESEPAQPVVRPVAKPKSEARVAKTEQPAKVEQTARAPLDLAANLDSNGAAKPAKPIVQAEKPQKPPSDVVQATEGDAGASGGAFVVQVASQKTEADAQSTYASLQRRFPSILGGRKASVRKVELGDRGTFYRIRVGPFASKDAAAGFCGSLKSAGGDCVISRN